MKSSPIVVLFLFMRLLSAQVQDRVDFIRAEVFVEPIPEEKRIKGTVTYEFLILKDVDSIFLDAHSMNFLEVRLNQKKVAFTDSGKTISITQQFKKDSAYTLELNYVVQPKQTVYFLGWNDHNPNNNQIWTQGQGKYTSYWLPSLDDMNDKIEFDLNFIVKEKYPVISNGRLVKKETLPDSDAFLWQFDMNKPMSSYLVAFAIGNYEKQVVHSTSGIPIELYFQPKDNLKVEPTYRYTKQIFDFFEEEIGIPYPWQNYKQVPVQDFLYAGMENTGATIFSNTFVVDSITFFDKSYVNVNAHEMAHQWFGNLVTEQSGADHWLHEGFATYYAYLAEKNIFGEEHFYWHLLETARALTNFSGTGNGEALTSPDAGSLTFYEKGAWALAILRERVGDANFRQGIQNYLSGYAYKNVTITDFIWEMERASGMKLSDFENIWLQESEFPFEVAKTFLIEKNSSIKKYFDILKNINEDGSGIENLLKKEWPNLKSDFLKHHLILDYGDKLSPQFVKEILSQENLKVRQALALSLKNVPEEIKNDFETLLLDKSYVTQESALYKLWSDFPENQNKYLDKTDGIIGLPNKNVRLLWLTLALVTPEYNIDLKPEYYTELGGYTDSVHHFEVRLLAFQYLKYIGGFNDEILKSLIESCSHHVWHFKKTCRQILKEFLKGEGNIAKVKALYPSLNQEEQQYLDKTMGK